MSKAPRNFKLPIKIQGDLSNISPGTKLIGTHSGRFHVDDVVAVGMVLQLPQYKDAVVIRSRNKDILQKCDIVLDVGDVYDAQKLRFDHHQRDFKSFYSEKFKHITKMSSAGLVFKHLGDSLLRQVFDVNLQEDMMEKFKTKLYEHFFLSLDAGDNGVSACEKPLYLCKTGLGDRISRINLEWFEWDGDECNSVQFLEALKLGISELSDIVDYLKRTYLRYSTQIKEAFDKRFSTHPSGRVLELEGGFGFIDHLVELEQENEIEVTKGLPNGILFVLAPSTKTTWHLKTVNKNPQSFESRLPLPERFRGLRRENLKELSGINFVHNNGFLAGVDSRKIALDLVDLTIKEAIEAKV